MTTPDNSRVTLESCICGKHFDCPDGWHYKDEDLPCGCTADCAWMATSSGTCDKCGAIGPVDEYSELNGTQAQLCEGCAP